MSRRRRSSESLDSGRSPSRLDQRFRPRYGLPSVQGPSRTRIPNTALEYSAYPESEASGPEYHEPYDDYDEWATLPSPAEQRPRGFITRPPGKQYPKPSQQQQARPIRLHRPLAVEDWDDKSVEHSPRISYQVDRDISRPSYSSSGASSRRTPVKSTISEDLSTEDRDQGAKLRFLQTRLQNQSFNLRPTQRP